MKHSTLFKHLLALLLVFAMVLPLCAPLAAAEQAPAAETPAADETEAPDASETREDGGSVDFSQPLQPAGEEANYGLIHQYHYGTTAVTDAYLRGEALSINGANATDTLPSKYDSRDYNYVTSVKNQNPYGSCWAHAAMASVESYMIKHSIPVGTGAAATTSLNLSETQHCFFNYSTAYDAESMTNGDKCTLTGSDSCLDSGGNGEMSAYTLQHWTGVASESVSALAYSKASTVVSPGLSSQYAYGSNVAHVQNSEWIPGTNIDAVKQAIMDYGAGNISYYETGNAYTYTCTIDNTSQDSSSHKWANHAITVVGWDDTIAASRFSPNKPSGTGAWICKNSWGTGYFSSGYTYISYEDTTVKEGYIYFYDAEPIDNYAHNYQYDGTCNPVCYGKGWPSGQDYYVGFENDTKVANVFTAKGSELLKAVGFCSWDEGMNYTVEIYKNPTTGNPSSGTLMSTKTGYLEFSGYYTIKLDNPVSLAAGDTFSVVFTQNVPVADDSGKYVHTPYDATFNNTDVVDWAKWTHVNHGNTSYYKEPGGSWTDCPDNGDYRIKAYTNDVTFNVTAVSNNTAWGTVSVSGTTITAAPADGYYVAGYEVLSGTASATINGNIVNVAPESDCTIQVNFAPKPTYTVSFVASGKPEGSQTALVNDAITLPDSVSVTADGWTFAGWMDHQIDETAEAPEFHAPGADYTVTGNTTLYAVYTRVEEGTGAPYFKLVEAAPADWTGNYVITYGTGSSHYAMKGVTGSSNGTDIENSSNAAALSATGMTLNGTELTNVSDTYVFNVAASGSYYTIRSASTNVYVGETSSHYLGGYNTYSAGYCDWTLGTQTNTSSATCVNGGNYPYLSFNPSGSYFWTQGSNGISNGYVYNVRWWKEANSSTTYYWTDPVAYTEPAAYPVVKGVSLTLNGMINANAYISIPAALVEAGIYAVIDGGEPQLVTNAVLDEQTGFYRFTQEKAAKNMTTKISLRLQDAEENVITLLDNDGEPYENNTVHFCVEDYLQSAISRYGSSTEEKYQKLVALCKAMSDYGCYAQVQQGYTSEDAPYPATYHDKENPDPFAAVTADALGSRYDLTKTDSETGLVTYYGASVLMRSGTVIRVYFKVNGTVSEDLPVTATVDGETAEVTHYGTGKYYYVDLADIHARNLGEGHTFTLSWNGETATVGNYSVYTYVAKVLGNTGSEASLVNVVKAIYRYGEAAKAYFGA